MRQPPHGAERRQKQQRRKGGDRLQSRQRVSAAPDQIGDDRRNQKGMVIGGAAKPLAENVGSGAVEGRDNGSCRQQSRDDRNSPIPGRGHALTVRVCCGGGHASAAHPLTISSIRRRLSSQLCRAITIPRACAPSVRFWCPPLAWLTAAAVVGRSLATRTCLPGSASIPSRPT